MVRPRVAACIAVTKRQQQGTRQQQAGDTPKGPDRDATTRNSHQQCGSGSSSATARPENATAERSVARSTCPEQATTSWYRTGQNHVTPTGRSCLRLERWQHTLKTRPATQNGNKVVSRLLFNNRTLIQPAAKNATSVPELMARQRTQEQGTQAP